MGAFSVLVAPALADPIPSSYRQSVELSLRQLSAGGDAGAADQTLRAGTGESQPEILADLGRRPPDVADAVARLRALDQALATTAPNSQPAAARARVRQILAETRYASLRAQPGPLQRLESYLGSRLVQLLSILLSPLRWLFGAGAIAFPFLTAAVAAAAAALGVWVLIRHRRRQLTSPPGRLIKGQEFAGEIDYWGAADALARTGDFTAAVRQLALGTAHSLERGRPLADDPSTVREIFRRADDPDRLRPLLQAFEAGFYGHHPIDQKDYGQALTIAISFGATGRADRAG